MAKIAKLLSHSSEDLLSFEQAAARLGIRPGTLRNWVSMHRIEYVKVGSLTRFEPLTLTMYIERHRVKAAG